MSEHDWESLYDCIASLPEGSQARVRCGSALLMVERRGDVWLALRECSLKYGMSWGQHGRPEGWRDNQPMQRLRLGQSEYLCGWKRMPTDLRWLKDLAALQC